MQVCTCSVYYNWPKTEQFHHFVKIHFCYDISTFLSPGKTNDTFTLESGPHWEELLQSVSDFIFSKHYGYRSRGLRGVKRSEKLWEIQNYPLPGRPFTHHWVKSKTICHFLRNFDAFLNGFWFYSILAGWSTWQWVFLNFSQNFWSFDTLETPGSVSAVFAENEICYRLK